ncbi:hypothetical protein [Psychrobacter jeotgali]|nr:hypothetical protein [Psychrobacter jeotgali]
MKKQMWFGLIAGVLLLGGCAEPPPEEAAPVEGPADAEVEPVEPLAE